MHGVGSVRCLCRHRSVTSALCRVGVLFVCFLFYLFIYFRILHFAFHSVCQLYFYLRTEFLDTAITGPGSDLGKF